MNIMDDANNPAVRVPSKAGCAACAATPARHVLINPIAVIPAKAGIQ
jgi:hypothetical protein